MTLSSRCGPLSVETSRIASSWIRSSGWSKRTLFAEPALLMRALHSGLRSSGTVSTFMPQRFRRSAANRIPAGGPGNDCAAHVLRVRPRSKPSQTASLRSRYISRAHPSKAKPHFVSTLADAVFGAKTVASRRRKPSLCNAKFESMRAASVAMPRPQHARPSQ
jgi:hypothetical protein